MKLKVKFMEDQQRGTQVPTTGAPGEALSEVPAGGGQGDQAAPGQQGGGLGSSAAGQSEQRLAVGAGQQTAMPPPYPPQYPYYPQYGPYPQAVPFSPPIWPAGYVGPLPGQRYGQPAPIQQPVMQRQAAELEAARQQDGMLRYGKIVNSVERFLEGESTVTDVVKDLYVNTSQDDQFWKGMLVGAAAAVLLSSPTVRRAMGRTLKGGAPVDTGNGKKGGAVDRQEPSVNKPETKE